MVEDEKATKNLEGRDTKRNFRMRAKIDR